jgi:hypothetical protein
VVGAYVFVAQCRVGAPASDCVSDALVESVDGGSAVDRTVFAGFATLPKSSWTEIQCVGSSIPPLATTPLQALRLVFGLAFCLLGACIDPLGAGIDPSEFCIGISGYPPVPPVPSRSRLQAFSDTI